MTQNLQIQLAPPAAHRAPGREPQAADGGDFDGMLREQLGAASDAATQNAPASDAPMPAGNAAAAQPPSSGGPVHHAEKLAASPSPTAAPPDPASAADPETISGLMPAVIPALVSEAADGVPVSPTGVAAAVAGALAGAAQQPVGTGWPALAGSQARVPVPVPAAAPVQKALETGRLQQPGQPSVSSKAMPRPTGVSSPVAPQPGRAEEAAARARLDASVMPAARADTLTPVARASGTTLQPPLSGRVGASSESHAPATPTTRQAVAAPGGSTPGATLQPPLSGRTGASSESDAPATPAARPAVPPMPAGAAPGVASQPAPAMETSVNTGRDAAAMSAGRSVAAMSASAAPAMALPPSPAVETPPKTPPDVGVKATARSSLTTPVAAPPELVLQPSSGLEVPANTRLDAVARPAARPASPPPAAIGSEMTLQPLPGVETVAKTALERLAKSVEAPTGSTQPGAPTSTTAPLVILPSAQPTAGQPLEVLAPVNTSVADPDWGSAMGARLVWSAAQGVQSATIALNPRELGPLQLTLTMSEDEASVSFVSNHTAVREAIEAALPRLREMFASDGLVLREVTVSAGDGHAGSGQPGAGDGERGDGGRGEMPAEATPVLPARPGDGLVDTFA